MRPFGHAFLVVISCVALYLVTDYGLGSAPGCRTLSAATAAHVVGGASVCYSEDNVDCNVPEEPVMCNVYDWNTTSCDPDTEFEYWMDEVPEVRAGLTGTEDKIVGDTAFCWTEFYCRAVPGFVWQCVRGDWRRDSTHRTEQYVGSTACPNP